MAINRLENWRKFAAHMERYIKENTIEKYTSRSNNDIDLMSISNSPIICVWNILKYTMRVWNGKMKPHDIEKIVHYAEMAWTISKGRIIENELKNRKDPVLGKASGDC